VRRQRGKMRMFLMGIIIFIFVACIPQPPQFNQIVQTLPSVDSDYAIYAGCVRAVARLMVRSRSYSWSEDDIANYCAEIMQSFRDERPQRGGGTL
jgi:hypothetical protein